MLEAVFTSGVDEITVHGLTQWDKGQQLRVALYPLPASFEVHFANKRAENAYVVDVTASNGVAVINIPNAILRNPVDAMAWIYIVNGDAGETVKTIHLPIERRTKPADYVYEEAEIANFREIVNQRIDEYIESGVIVPGATVEEVTKIKEFTIDQVEFEHTGNPAQFDSFSGCPLNCVTRIEPAQAGSGDPSPSNIRPISGRTSAELTRCGVNLFRPSFIGTRSANGITCTLNAIGAATLNGTATGTAIFNIYDGSNFFDPNKDYSLSYTSKYAGAANAEMGVWCIDGNGVGKYVAATPDAYQVTFRVPADTVTVQIRIRLTTGATFSNFLFPVYLNEGTQIIAGKYYEGETFSASFGQTVYGGTLDWGKGVLTVDRGYTAFNGSENWVAFTYADGKQGFYTSGSNALPGIISGTHIYIPGICSWSPSVDGYIRDVLRTDIDAIAIEIKPDVLSKWGINDLDTFKARLAANPMQLAYKLATHTTIQLTPAQLTALQGMNNIFCDAGETTVSGRKDILWLTDYLLKRVKELESAVATLQTAAVNNV